VVLLECTDAVEAEYRRLRDESEPLRAQSQAGAVDRAAHERFRERARALLRRLEGEQAGAGRRTASARAVPRRSSPTF